MFDKLLNRNKNGSQNVSAVNLVGQVDGLKNGHLHGWVGNKSDIFSPLELCLIINGEEAMTFIANTYREDVKKAGYGNGKLGFKIKIPSEHLSAEESTISLVEKNSREELKNSPVIIPGEKAEVKVIKVKNYLHEEIGADFNTERYQTLLQSLFEKKNWKEIIHSLEYLPKDTDLNGSTSYIIGKAFLEEKNNRGAERYFSDATNKDFQNLSYHLSLADSFHRQKKYWQETEALTNALSLDPEDVSILNKMGKAYYELENYRQAIAHLEKSNPLDKEGKYMLGESYFLLDQKEKSTEYFQQATASESNSKYKNLGQGYYYFQKRLWGKASSHFQEALKLDPLNAELHYFLGNAYDRMYQWPKAIEYYKNAISLMPTKDAWHYRLGFVFERVKDYKSAVESYSAALVIKKDNSDYWLYRLGFVLDKLKDYKKACFFFREISKYKETLESTFEEIINEETDIELSDASADALISGEAPESGLDNNPNEEEEEFQNPLFESYNYDDYISRFSVTKFINKSLVKDTTNEALFIKQARESLAKKDWSNAVEAIEGAIKRTSDHNPEYLFIKGYCLEQLEQYEEASKAYIEMRVLGRPFGVNTDNYIKSQSAKDFTHFTEFYETLPIKEKTIMYESFNAISIGGNPRAIFMQLIDDPKYSDWLHVWAINKKTRIPEEFKSYENVIFVRKENSYGYKRYLATAKYLVNNSTFPYYFIRRKEQKYLNTWHGTPLKTLGKDINSVFYEHKNTARNLLHATHILTPNQHTTEVLIDKNEINGLYAGKISATGYPRIDRTLNQTQEDKDKIVQSLKLDATKKNVLYAPTFRGTLANKELQLERINEDLKRLEALDCNILFRGHYFIESLLSINHNVKIIPQKFDTNDLLSIVDVLISDYSSIFFDFMVTENPIILYAHDLESYNKNRGMYFDIEKMPGHVCYNLDDLITKVTDTINNFDSFKPDQKYLENKAKFCKYEDGKAAQKAIDFFLNDDDTHLVEYGKSKKPNMLLFQGPFMPNGIRSSFINLTQNIDYDKYDVTVVFDPGTISRDEEWMEKLKFVANETPANAIGRVGRMNTTAEERYLMTSFDLNKQFFTKEHKELYKKAHRREFRRIFGDSKFVASVDFEGYSIFWAAILGFGPEEEKTFKTIYQHNDMHSEWKVKYPYLKRLFNLYSSFDSIVAVSEKTMQLNIKNLSREFNIENDKFNFCINSIVPKEIIARSEQFDIIEADKWFKTDGSVINFISLGRLSVEKDHPMMFEAFHKVYQKHKNIRLTVFGEGPYRSRLEQLIKDLDLEKVVRIPGNIPNPFPYLKNSDCFLLSSNHEGQPMVLLESMVLKKAIVSSDITGSRSVLEGGYGHLVPNDKDSFAQGMLDFLDGSLTFTPFDYDKYVAQAMDMFYKKNGIINTNN